jgi:hypothetical protein
MLRKIPDLGIFSSFTDFRQGNNTEAPNSEICLNKQASRPCPEKNTGSWDIF